MSAAESRRAFWLLAQLVERVLYAGTYAPNLAGCLTEMRALEDLVASKLPRLARHMAELEVDVGVLAADWWAGWQP